MVCRQCSVAFKVYRLDVEQEMSAAACPFCGNDPYKVKPVLSETKYGFGLAVIAMLSCRSFVEIRTNLKCSTEEKSITYQEMKDLLDKYHVPRAKNFKRHVIIKQHKFVLLSNLLPNHAVCVWENRSGKQIYVLWTQGKFYHPEGRIYRKVMANWRLRSYLEVM